MPINPCTGAPGATPHSTCIAANPPGHASPPGTHGTGGKRSLPAGRPVRPVYQSDQIEHVKGTGGKIKLLRELLNTLAAAQALNPRGAADVPPPTGDEIFSVPPDYVS